MIGWIAIVGCVTESTVFEDSWDTFGVAGIVADVERGDVLYAGTSPRSFELRVERWGTAALSSAALARAESTTWSAAIDGENLALFARSNAPSSGVDFRVEGPTGPALDAVLLQGVLTATDLEGPIVATSSGFVGRRVRGSVDLLVGSEGVDLDAEPLPGSVLRIEAESDVVLSLPYGLEYDLEAFPDPDFPSEVGDIGFDELTVAPDYVRGRTGSGSVRIEVYVTRGALTVWLPR